MKYIKTENQLRLFRGNQRRPSATSVCTSLLRSTFSSCACLSWTMQVALTCAQLFAVTCKSPQLVLLLMN